VISAEACRHVRFPSDCVAKLPLMRIANHDSVGCRGSSAGAAHVGSAGELSGSVLLFVWSRQGGSARSSGATDRRFARSELPLLTEDATREFRQILLRCKARPGSNQIGCPAVITGHASQCSLTGPLGSTRSLPCIVVENGRELRWSLNQRCSDVSNEMSSNVAIAHEGIVSWREMIAD